MAFVAFCSTFVRAAQDEPRDAIDKLHFMEIDQQAEGNIQQLHVAQQLCLVDWQDGFDCLEFDEKTSVDEQIEPQLLCEHEVFVIDDDFLLVDRGNAPELELT